MDKIVLEYCEIFGIGYEREINIYDNGRIVALGNDADLDPPVWENGEISVNKDTIDIIVKKLWRLTPNDSGIINLNDSTQTFKPEEGNYTLKLSYLEQEKEIKWDGTPSNYSDLINQIKTEMNQLWRQISLKESHVSEKTLIRHYKELNSIPIK